MTRSHSRRYGRRIPTQNDEIAGVFGHIAALVNMKGESFFKVRAYQRAAETVAALPYSIADVAGDEKALLALPGFGKAIAAKVQELVSTGRMDFYERLKSEFPPVLLTLARVPEVDPRAARRAVEALGVVDVEGLVRAIESGEFGAQVGVGEEAARAALQEVREAAVDER